MSEHPVNTSENVKAPRRWRIFAISAALFLLLGAAALATMETIPGLESLRAFALGQLGPTPSQVLQAEDPLQRQEAALRPEFQADLEGLSRAPRYTLEATIVPQQGTITGTLQVDYTNVSRETLNELVFRLFPNASTVYGGGSLTVTAVTQGPTPLQPGPSDDPTILPVPLAKPLAPDAAVSVTLDFEAQAPSGFGRGYGIFHHTQSILSLAGWYPILAPYESGWVTPAVPPVGDALQADTSFYQVRLSLPPGYQVASTGVSVGSAAPANGTAASTTEAESAVPVTYEFVSGPVREFALVISDRYETTEKVVDGVTLRLHTMDGVKAVTPPDKAMEMLEGAFTVFEERFGPYPFTELDVVEAPISIGGYEFSGMVVVDTDLRTQGGRADYEYILVHEVAHQWWYGLVGSPTVEEPWLDEAHASYAASLYLESVKSPETGARLLSRWKADLPNLQPGDPPVNSSAQDFTNWAVYRTTVYTQGAFFLAELRQEMGDEAFFSFLRRFQTEYRYQAATTADYQAVAEEVAGRDLKAVFDKWFALSPVQE